MSTKATTKVDAFKDAFYQTARNTPSSQKAQQEIKQVFMKPTKLVRACVFQEHHKFPATEAAAASKLLTGGDRALFTFMQVLGKQLGFKLYLTNVCYKVTGDMMTEHRQRGYGYRYGDYGFDYDVFGDDGPGNSDEEAENYSMEDAEEEGYSIEVKAVVDLDGMPVSLPKLDLDEANIVNGKLDSGKPDQKKFYYEDGHCGELVHLWNRTVLLIIPITSDVKAVTGDVLHYACHALQVSQSRSSSDKEKQLLAGLVRSCTNRAASLASGDQTSYGTVKVSVELSIRWKDVSTFLRVGQVCNLTTHTDALLDPEGFASVYRAFPAQWESLKEIFSKVVEHSSSNLTRGALLEKISAAAKGKKGVAAVTAWHKIQNGFILSNLKLLQPDEVEWLTGVVKKHDINFFRDILLPQLRNQPHEKKFWFPFIKALNWEKAGISTLEATEVISLCVRHVVDKTSAYPQKPYDPRDEDDVPKLLCRLLRGKVQW
ncbi:uncharacterized protein EV420DRAFT_1635717 [Desarmillaria tabescens]|uniref:Uncharacterized protein n=1 Tax=Armillaria tabescens TaxID=1929756 RepID=A0AA39U795_ARMTA|nr:uncharacterized protein EV420DRAFT_1635717 [Desarmillaria tabescens]KAK0468465.1 hypothetical protein EV420DRAFT_1635717 [Desarmillaria tabescens]